MSVVTLTNKNFKNEVIDYNGTVLIDFWADWCGPCKMFSPIIDEIAEENTGNLKVCKVNVTEEEDLASEYRVMSIPMILVFKNGKITNKAIGLQSKEEVLKML